MHLCTPHGFRQEGLRSSRFGSGGQVGCTCSGSPCSPIGTRWDPFLLSQTMHFQSKLVQNARIWALGAAACLLLGDCRDAAQCISGPLIQLILLNEPADSTRSHLPLPDKAPKSRCSEGLLHISFVGKPLRRWR